jgi:hypothetical protein
MGDPGNVIDIDGDGNDDIEIYILNRSDLNWSINAREIKNTNTQTLTLQSKVIDISASKIDISYGTVHINKLIIKNNLNILGGFSMGGIAINNITKTLQTLHYSPDNLYPNDLSNHYINASNLNKNFLSVLSYEILYDLSINITPKNINSTFRLSTNLNYLTSNYNDTKLNIELYYNIEPSCGAIVDNSEVLVADYLLGTDNVTILYDLFSNNILLNNIPFNLYDKIFFYYKVRNLNLQLCMREKEIAYYWKN